jgi:hypothetical protein
LGVQSYLIRYGIMSHVGRFSASPIDDTSFDRGQFVVLQTDRGLELGEVLIAVDDHREPAGPEVGAAAGRGPEDADLATSGNAPGVLRLAGPDDLSRSRRAEDARPGRFSLCQRILQEGNWPWPVIDVEPLLDGRSTVIHYLGPHQIDVASLRARFRVECDIDIVLEPVGADLDSELAIDDDHSEDNAQGCGSCGCSDGGGCGTKPAAETAGHAHQPEPAAAGCSTKAHSGCSSCGISRLLTERARAQA